MQSAGNSERGDQGGRPPFIQVGRTPVIIDLVTLYPYEPHHDGVYHPDGLQFRKRAKGVLTEWGISVDGEWLGKVTYTIPTKDRDETVTHWVPAWALRRVAADGSAQP